MSCVAGRYDEGLGNVIAYLSSVYRENASVFWRMGAPSVREAARSLGWVYHQAHWANGSLWVQSGSWAYPCPWLPIRCLSLYHGYPSTHARTTEVLAFGGHHLLTSYNKYGLMRGAGQTRCGDLLGTAPTGASRVEVLRTAGGTDKIEYGVSGCWYYAMPGSGVFLDVGRTLRADNRSHLGRLLGLHAYNASELHVLSHLHANWTWSDVETEMERRTPWDFDRRIGICLFARRLGYDTVQIADETCTTRRFGGRTKGTAELACLEIVSCSRGCMALRHHRVRESTCVPDEPLYTGWGADRPCACDPSYPLLNCHRTAPHIPRFAHRRTQGEFIMRQLWSLGARCANHVEPYISNISSATQ